ncbi:hypothetical protein [Paraburkholderia sp. HD33-4]|uniref:hypothetical protein n=1 Tax=Paraburkholderia sp. HD33-4 TaxID=2883242 RepID=UPI001F292E10|nr:hypothetical protein [Paraburkholderia sp. HD33-4]
MPVVRSFRRCQWEALGRRLDALPEKVKDDQPLKVGEGVKSIRTQISAARERGYTLNELIEQAVQEGIDVTLNSLRYAMRQAEGKGRVRPGSRNTVRNQTTTPARGSKSARAGTAHDNPLRTGSEQKGNGDVKTVGQPVQGFLGFPIRPDTEDL